MTEDEAMAPRTPDAAEENPVLSQDFGCPKCGRAFTNAAALRMHNIRKHTRGWDTARNFRGAKKRSKLEQLARRRIYQKQLRERYYAEGRNSKGEQMPPGWKPNPRKMAAAAKRKYNRKLYATHKAEANNSSTTVSSPDIYSNAASAIMLAANVIRAVTTGLKIGGIQ